MYDNAKALYHQAALAAEERLAKKERARKALLFGLMLAAILVVFAVETPH